VLAIYAAAVMLCFGRARRQVLQDSKLWTSSLRKSLVVTGAALVPAALFAAARQAGWFNDQPHAVFWAAVACTFSAG
jgi:hypothetical protein